MSISSPCIARLLLVIGVSVSASVAQAASVMPGVSSVSAQAQMGTPLITVLDNDLQNGALAPLSADALQTGGPSGTLSLDVDSAAAFTSAQTGVVTQRHLRDDTRSLGTDVIWGGVANFRYDFTVDAATQVVIDYDTLGSTNVAFETVRWSGMQGFTLTVNGDARHLNWSLIDALAHPATPESPLPLIGQFAWNVGPGAGFIQIQLAASSGSSNGGGTRLMEGSFAFRIGTPTVTPVPLPASLPLLLVGLSALALRRTQLTRRNC
ncbi:MAG: hypothetical protein AB7I01_10540 [Gammaproteobacteria bacterium]